jgi:hypothetical protein
MRHLKITCVLAVLAANAACAPREAERTCTLIGCDDGWAVEIVGGTLPATYTVRAVVDGRVVATHACTPDNPCGRQLFLPGLTAAQADLEIVGADLDLRWTVRPEYQLVQPNGPDCPPTCRQARVQVRL